MIPYEHILWEQDSDDDYFYKIHTESSGDGDFIETILPDEDDDMKDFEEEEEESSDD